MNVNGKYRYRINEDLTVEIWSSDRSDNEAPSFYQGFKPGGELFTSVDDVTSWTERFLSEIQAPEPVEPEVAPKL